jgi:hypothetical protein
MMKGTAGIPATKPGRVYHGVERAAGSGNDTPLVTRHSNAIRFATTYASRGAPKPAGSSERCRERRGREISQNARHIEQDVKHII